MSYLSSQPEVHPQSAELLSGNRAIFGADVQTASDDKWPLWWTVVGATAFCGTFWTLFIQLVF